MHSGIYYIILSTRDCLSVFEWSRDKNHRLKLKLITVPKAFNMFRKTCYDTRFPSINVVKIFHIFGCVCVS